MRLTTRVGLFCACIGLIAPRVFGDAVSLEGKTFSTPSELFLIEVEHTQDGVDTGGFTLELCSHCKVNGESPFVFNPNLSQAPFSRDIFAPFGGTSSLTGATGNMGLPVPILSATINGIASPSSTTTITIFDSGAGMTKRSHLIFHAREAAKLNGIIGDGDVMNAESLAKVKMPNRDGFVSAYPNKH